MSMDIQQYLLTHSFNDLAKDHGIYPGFGKKGKQDNTKFSLNYDQIESKNSNPLTHECRGLILRRIQNKNIESLDEVIGTTVVVAKPFKRFFNYGQPEAALKSLEGSDVLVMEKRDGTLGILYFDHLKTEWCIATRSTPEADLPIQNIFEKDFTFSDLFQKCLKDMGYHNPDDFYTQLDSKFTYCFEITSPLNKVVVSYQKNELTLLAVIETTTGKEWNYNQLKNGVAGIPFVQHWFLKTFDELISFIVGHNPSEFEGIVAMDSEGNRVKLKHPGYLALAHIKDSACSSRRNLLELILLEKADDAYPLLPSDFQKELLSLQEKVNKMFSFYDEHFKSLPKEGRKEFAIEVQNRKLWIGPLMNMFLGKCSSMKEFVFSLRSKENTWSDSTIDKLLELTSTIQQ